MKKNILCFLLLFSGFIHAQLTINNPTSLTPKQLVETKLVGVGVTPLNIKFNGNFLKASQINDQAANYTTNFNPTNLGLSQGVLLTTGKSQVALGPNNSASLSMESSSTLEGDADLALLSGQTIRKVAVLEFDFVATGLLLNFDFVFASEEYPEYVNSAFNDVFGFFLSGPGISGTFSNGSKNIAIVPNTSIPISIGTINNGYNNNGVLLPNQFPAYYYNNTTIGLNPNTSSIYTVQYDGFTKPLVAKSELQCGELYHIKLAVGNASDNAWDSAVFLKNFTIPLLEIVDEQGQSSNIDVCFGRNIEINTGNNWPAGTQFVWKKNTVLIPNESDPSKLHPTVDGQYCVKVYTPLSCLIAEDCVDVTFRAPMPITAPTDIELCLPTPFVYPFDQDINKNTSIIGLLNPADYNITYYDSSYIDAFNASPTGIISLADLSTYPINSVSTEIWVRIEETGGATCVVVKSFKINVSPAPSGTFSYPFTSYCTDITVDQLVIPTSLTVGGTYSTLPAGLTLNAVTGTIKPSSSLPGNYIVTYTIPAAGSCLEFTTTANVTINSVPIAPVVLINPITYCQNISAIALTAIGTNLLWYVNPTGGTGDPVVPIPDTSASGNFTFYVSQSNGGCEGPRTQITVTVLPTLVAPTVIVTQPTCTVATGKIEITAPLTANLEYSVDNGITYQASPVFPLLASGVTYDVGYKNTITGCVSQSIQVILIPNIGVPPTPTVNVTFQPNCTTPNGTFEVITPLDTVLYKYSIDGTIYQTATIFTGLTPNTNYTVTVKNGSTGCVSSGTLVHIDALPINPIAPSGTITQPTCLVPTGNLNITNPLGANIEYSIDLGLNYQTSTLFSGLLANANYSVIVRNTITGCVSTASSFGVNPIPVNSLVATTTITQPSCSNPKGSFVINSPIGIDYEYSINNGTSYQTGVLFDLLNAGTTYSLTIREISTGCVSAGRNVVINPALNIPNAPTASTTVQPNCILPFGKIEITAPIGLNLNYSIDGGTTFQTSTQFPNLAPNATYNLIVKNITTGCVSNSSAVVVLPVSANPLAPTASTSIQPNCIISTGTIEVTLPLGTNYKYSKDGVTYQTSAIFAGLAPNNSYNISVKDLNTGCVSPATAVFVSPIPDNPVAPIGTITQPTCTVQSGKIEITSPLGNDLKYSINGGIYQTNAVFSNLVTNSIYTIKVKNNSTGCVSTVTTFSIDPTPLLPATPIALGNNACVGETINLNTATVIGATYSWTGPDGFISSDQNPIIIDATVTMSGSYKVTISLTPDCPSLPGIVSVWVNPLPNPILKQDGFICVDNTAVLDNQILDTGLDNLNYDFEWYKIENAISTLIIGETNPTYVVTAPGIYGVIVKNNITNCLSDMVTTTVIATSPPKDIDIFTSNYFEDNQAITINVSPIGAYEYQIDNGAFQSSNVFSNVTSGSHTITVKNNCGEKTGEASLVDFPKFFTPNNDGFNDTWNVFALKSQTNSRIYIFDRFGKLLKEITTKDDGWNGKIDQQNLPASDYWFTIYYEENKVNKVFKSHFALKR